MFIEAKLGYTPKWLEKSTPKHILKFSPDTNTSKTQNSNYSMLKLSKPENTPS